MLNCFIHSSIIRNENSYFFNDCHKICHEKCLKDLKKKRSKASIPKKLLDYKDNRKIEVDY